MLNNQTQNNISYGAISSCFKLDATLKKKYDVDLTMQVISTKKSDNKQAGKHITSVTLSDLISKYQFVVIHDEEDPGFKLYDLIRIKMVQPTIFKKEEIEKTVFLVTSYEKVCECEIQYGSPKEYVREKSSFNDNQENFHDQDHSDANTRSAESNRTASRVLKGFPLSALTTFSKDFTVIVKITKKSDLRTYVNNKGEGCLFSFSMLDDEGTEMEGTAFNATAKKVHTMLDKDKVYSIKGCYIKISDKKYSSVKGDYRMILDDNVVIQEVEDQIDESNIKLFFTKISDVFNMSTNEALEVIGKIIEVSELKEINTKNGTQKLKKIKLVDISDTTIEVSLWRQHADYDLVKGEIIALKNVKISTYNNNKTLNTIDNTVILKNPNVPEKVEIDLHFNSGIDETKLKSMNKNSAESKKLHLSHLNDVLNALEDLTIDKMPVFKVKATITSFHNQEKNFYLGCSECNRKLIEESSFTKVLCNNCNKTQDTPHYIYSFSIKIKDITSEEYVDLFGDLAEKITHMKCEDYRELFAQGDDVGLKKLKNEVEYKEYYFLIKPKIHIFNNQQRKKIVVLRIDPVENTTETNRLINEIDNLFSL